MRKKAIAKVGETNNPLYGYNPYMGAGSLATPTIATVTFKGLSKKEKEHVRAKAVANFKELHWIAEKMQESNCTYKEALIAVLNGSK